MNKMGKKIVLLIAILLLISTGFFCFISYNNKQNEIKKEKEMKVQLEDRIKHYGNYVITNKETNLYKLENNGYKENGKIGNSVKVILDNIDVKYNTDYFYIKDLDSYIYYKDVDVTDEFTYNDRYKKYIPFNKNIKTNNITNFYDENDNLVYQINDSFDFEVIINGSEKYGIEYNNQLLYVKNIDIDSVYDKDNGSSNKDRIKTLTYHLIYNPETTNCDESICQTLDMVESHLRYLSENDYMTLTMDELDMYMDGKLNIPKKSVVITIDDATVFDLAALDLFAKYKVYATLFVITKFNDNYDYLKSDYVARESHTNNMHNQYECAGYGSQGGGILCLPEDKVLEDLKTSQDKLGGSKYFSYPFFDFNDRAITLLKQAGFKMAFIGQYDTDGYSYPNVTDKYKMRRTTIFSDTSMEEFISYLN